MLALLVLLRPPPPAPALAIRSSEQCLECHPGVATEWQDSHHALAYVNPEVRKLSNDFQNEECLACHAPRPVFRFAAGERVLARMADRGRGVDCLACHLRSNGRGVATANPEPRADAPCRPVHEPRMAAVKHCAACHNQHGTIDQWRAAPETLDGQPFRGENCLHCHMPEVWRQGGRRGRDHAFRASHDLEALQAAVTFSGGWDDEGPWLAVRNDGAAHNFPTDERARAADVQVRWRRANGGWSDWQQVYRLRNPYRHEVELQDTELPSGSTWRQRLSPPPWAVAGEGRLLYKTRPYMPDQEARELFRVALTRP